MKKNTIKKRKIATDCWNLNMSFLVWLKEHLPIYLRDADKRVDLENYKFSYAFNEDEDPVEYTQKELIIKLIELVNWATNPDVDDWSDIYYKRVNQILDIWKLIFFAMWW